MYWYNLRPKDRRVYLPARVESARPLSGPGLSGRPRRRVTSRRSPRPWESRPRRTHTVRRERPPPAVSGKKKLCKVKVDINEREDLGRKAWILICMFQFLKYRSVYLMGKVYFITLRFCMLFSLLFCFIDRRKEKWKKKDDRSKWRRRQRRNTVKDEIHRKQIHESSATVFEYD